MGGEWASGAVLVSETWPAEHRNKAISIMQSGWALGYILAAVLAAIVLGANPLGADSWRLLFAAGALPALFVLWIRRQVREPEAWLASAQRGQARPNAFAMMFAGELRSRTILVILLGSAVQFAYWGLFFWLPGFLARPIAQGGAGMTVVSSLGWIIPVQIGAYLGYLTFGFIADRVGPPTDVYLFHAGGRDARADLRAARAEARAAAAFWVRCLVMSGTGTSACSAASSQSCFPPPSEARRRALPTMPAASQGALAPFVIGALAGVPSVGIGLALASTSAFFLAAAVLILALPDRAGQPLE